MTINNTNTDTDTNNDSNTDTNTNIIHERGINEKDSFTNKKKKIPNSRKKKEAQKTIKKNHDAGEEDDDPQQHCHPKWFLDMGRTADWWSLWIGLFSFCLAFAVVYAVPSEKFSHPKYVMPQPQQWNQNPLDAWNLYGIVGTLLLLLVLFVQYLVALKCMGKLGTSAQSSNNNKQMSASNYAKGFAVISVLALLAFWLGRNAWCLKHGLGYAVLSILLGMLLANIPHVELPTWLLSVAKDGEFFIKCSLVLLAVEFSVIAQFGWQSFVVSWIGSPLAIIIGFNVGTRRFKMDAGLAMLVVVGATWCGASAISAVGAVLGSKASDISTSISVVAFFTVIFTFAQAYIAIWMDMDDRVAGAWIGGSVDQTGNVVASAAIVSEEAAEVAAIVKMVLNSGLGILATTIAFWWQVREQHQHAVSTVETIVDSASVSEEEDIEMAPGTNNSGGNSNKEKFQRKPISLLILWEKFPKFILGYVLCSGILTSVVPLMERTEAASIMGALGTLNKWWFALAFVSIGLGTNVKKLWEAAFASGVIKLYLVANTFDIFLALGLAYAVF